MFIYYLILFIVAIALACELRFVEATKHIGISLSTTGTKRGLQDAITPPASSYAGIVIYVITLAAIAYGFYEFGLLRGIVALVAFYLFVMAVRVLFLPRPESDFFRNLILRSMIRRYADYRRDGDTLRAQTMADLIERMGMPISEL